MKQRVPLPELLDEFRSATLVTQDKGKLSANRMEVGKIEASGVMWFVADYRPETTDAIAKNPLVAITFQRDAKFASLSGVAEVVKDQTKSNEFWSGTWKGWYRAGKDDPNLILLRVSPSTGEHWDNSILSGLEHDLESGLAYWNAERPTSGESKTSAGSCGAALYSIDEYVGPASASV